MPSQFDGQVFEDNGKPISRLNVEIDYPGRVGDRIFTQTDINGKWAITLDANPNPEDVTVRFYGDGYETKIVTNPQPTEILRGFIDPIKGGILDLTGKYKDGKFTYNDFSQETQGLLAQELKDMWRFVTYNYGNYTLTIDATETRDEKNENTDINLLFPGTLAEARADELKKILDEQFAQYLSDAKSKSGEREGYALIGQNTDIPHRPKIELGSIDVVEGIKPGAKIKLNFIQPPINVPIPNSEEEFIQLLGNSGFTKISTQDEFNRTFSESPFKISMVEYIYWNKDENTIVIKDKSNPNSPTSKNIIRFERRGILIPLTEQITTYSNYRFTFDITNPLYEELKPQIQSSISKYIIFLQKKSNLTSLDKESLAIKINNISSLSTNVNPTYKDVTQRLINTDIQNAKDVIKNFSPTEQRELYNLLNKQRDIILNNGFTINVTW